MCIRDRFFRLQRGLCILAVGIGDMKFVAIGTNFDDVGNTC